MAAAAAAGTAAGTASIADRHRLGCTHTIAAEAGADAGRYIADGAKRRGGSWEWDGTIPSGACGAGSRRYRGRPWWMMVGSAKGGGRAANAISASPVSIRVGFLADVDPLDSPASNDDIMGKVLVNNVAEIATKEKRPSK